MGYENGKIYVLRSHQTEDIYLGSTQQQLYKRFHQHKTHYNRWKEGKKHYITSNELFKYDDCYIELLEEYPCDNKMELCRREGELIRSINCVNKFIAGRTKAECDKEYGETHKAQIKEYCRLRFSKIPQTTCECGSKVKRMSHHLNTIKHKNYILSKNNTDGTN